MMINPEIRRKDVVALRNLIRWAGKQKTLNEQQKLGMKWVKFCQDLDKKLSRTQFVGLN